jgi:hypothetical protein
VDVEDEEADEATEGKSTKGTNGTSKLDTKKALTDYNYYLGSTNKCWTIR